MNNVYGLATNATIETRLGIEVDRLHREFSPAYERTAIERRVFEVFELRYRDVPVSQFVPLFVYRRTREELLSEVGHTANGSA